MQNTVQKLSASTPSSIRKASSVGLSGLNEQMLILVLQQNGLSPSQHWHYCAAADAPDCDLIVIDIDSDNGLTLWQQFQHHADAPTLITVGRSTRPPGAEHSLHIDKPLSMAALGSLLQTVPPRRTSSPATVTTALRAAVTTPAATAIVEEQPRVDATAFAADRAPSPRFHADQKFRLIRWPDFKNLDYKPRHIKIAVVLNKQTHDIEEIVKICQTDRDETLRFLDQCYGLGYLEVVTTPADAAVVPRHLPTVGTGRLNLMHRIRRRLGL